MKGESAAVTREELAGVQTFVQAGCVRCHFGEFVGGGMYQKLGVMKVWQTRSDLGRYAVTKRDNDRLVFKVPSLRNVAKTGPYFHDGSIPTLEDAIRTMGEYQVGVQLTSAEVNAIVTWLNTLTGELPAQAIEPPQLPPDPPTRAAF